MITTRTLHPDNGPPETGVAAWLARRLGCDRIGASATSPVDAATAARAAATLASAGDTGAEPVLVWGLQPALLEAVLERRAHLDRGPFVRRVIAVLGCEAEAAAQLAGGADALCPRLAAALRHRKDEAPGTPTGVTGGLPEGLTEGVVHGAGLTLLAGDHALESLGNLLGSDLTVKLPSRVLSLTRPATPSLRSEAERLRSLLAAAHTEQKQACAALQAAVEARYAGVQPLALSARLRDGFERACSLRVLIVTSRHSTFVRHAGEDLALGLCDLGHDARVVMEPDRHSTLVRNALLAAIETQAPDLLVFINYTRATFPGLPESLPVVTWVQDAMSHLFERDAGWGRFDAAIGYVYPELQSNRAGLGKLHPFKARYAPVAVSEAKFFTADAGGAVDAPPEIAFVSHHAAPPEHLAAELAQTLGDGGDALVASLLGQARQLCDAASTRAPYDALVPTARATLNAWRRGAGADATVVAKVAHTVLAPLVGRVYRHETLAWARSICERRGWSLRVYGRGWAEQPEWAPFAAGEVEHGEELRRCYAGAAAHLHVDPVAVVHQRVMECTLSGGLPVVRLHAGVLDIARLVALSDLAANGSNGNPGDSAEAANLMLAAQRLGLPYDGELRLREDEATPQTETDGPFRALDPLWLLGDPAQIGFFNEAELDRVLRHAVERPAWRRGMANHIAQRTRRWGTSTKLGEALVTTAYCCAWLEAGDPPEGWMPPKTLLDRPLQHKRLMSSRTEERAAAYRAAYEATISEPARAEPAAAVGAHA